MRVELNEDYCRLSGDYLETLRTLMMKARVSELNETEQDLRRVEFAPKAMQLGRLEKLRLF